MRQWRIVAALAFALVAAGCGDEDEPSTFGPTGNIAGTWVLEGDEGTTFVRVLPASIQIYEEADTCFRRRDYGIEAVDGTMFTLVRDTLQANWSFEVRGETLVITDGAESMELVPTNVSVESLQLCAAVVIFGNLHPSCEELPRVPVPGSVTGVLQEGDARWDGAWYDLYSVQLSSPASLTMSLTSVDGDIDTWLGVYNYTGSTRIIRNDDIDFPANPNSRLQVDLEPGCYVIVANSYDGDDPGEDGGNYLLQIEGNVPPEPDFPTPACTTLPRVALESSVMGLLEDADAHWSDGTYYDLYSLQLDAGAEVTIEHRAGADTIVDPYLYLYNDDATERIDQDDDSAGDLDSQIVATLDPGCYIIVAASWSETPEDAGTYMVSAATGTVEPAFPHEVCVNLPAIAPGQTVNGVLEAGDTTWFDTWIDLYSLQLTETTNIRATLTEDGSGIDTYLGVWDFQAGTRLVRNDDIDADNDNLNSQIEYTFDPGCYIVGANSYEGDDEGETGGAYVLSMETF